MYRDYVGILLNNEVWREQLATVPFDRRLLLLPKCLRVEDKCPAPFDEFGLLCKQCGLCTIQDLQEEAERLGYAVLVAEGSALVMALIQTGKIEAIVGVSCLSVLERAFPYMEAAAIPGVAIPLLQDDCKDTTVDLDWVWDVIHLTSDDRTRRLDLDALRERGRDVVRAGGARRAARAGRAVTPTASRANGSRRDGKRWRPFLTACACKALQDDPDRPLPGIAAQGGGGGRVLSQGLADSRRHRRRRRAALRRDDAARRARRAGRAECRRSAGRRRLSAARRVRRSGAGLRRAGPDRVRRAPRAVSRSGRGAVVVQAPAPLTADQVVDIFRRKTAPAFEVALGIGAALAGAGAETQQVLRDYSEALGIAYQIRDDLEDLSDKGTADDCGVQRAVAAPRARLRPGEGVRPRSRDDGLARRAHE